MTTLSVLAHTYNPPVVLGYCVTRRRMPRASFTVLGMRESLVVKETIVKVIIVIGLVATSECLLLYVFGFSLVSSLSCEFDGLSVEINNAKADTVERTSSKKEAEIKDL